MSRGTEVKEQDEMHAVCAIGEAINMLALYGMRTLKYRTYEAARAGAAEDMAFVLRDLVLHHRG